MEKREEDENEGEHNMDGEELDKLIAQGEEAEEETETEEEGEEGGEEGGEDGENLPIGIKKQEDVLSLEDLCKLIAQSYPILCELMQYRHFVTETIQFMCLGTKGEEDKIGDVTPIEITQENFIYELSQTHLNKVCYFKITGQPMPTPASNTTSTFTAYYLLDYDIKNVKHIETLFDYIKQIDDNTKHINCIITAIPQFAQKNSLKRIDKVFESSIQVYTKLIQHYNETKYKKVTQIFYIKRLSFNVTKHDMVPKHEIVSETEMKELIKLYRRQDLPLISWRDSVAMFIGLMPKDICRITRRSESGDYTSYRRCV